MLPVLDSVLRTLYFVLSDLEGPARTSPICIFQFSICNSNPISHPSPSSQEACPSSGDATTHGELLSLPGLRAEVRIIEIKQSRADNRSRDQLVRQRLHEGH